jgi:hypothetical protein
VALTLVLLEYLKLAEILSLFLGSREESFAGLAIVNTFWLIVCGVDGTRIALGVSLEFLLIEFLEVLHTVHQLIVFAGLI